MTTAAPAPSPASAPYRLSPQNRRVFVGLMLGMLVASVSQTIVGPAMPRIVAELGGMEHYSWVATAAMLVSAVSVPIIGKLSDLYGRRRFYLGGIVVFMVGSLVCGFASSFWILVAGRAIQGLGMGTLMPLSQTIIGDIIPPRQRGKYQGLMGAVFGVTSVAGPLAGGFITDHWGWRWLFFVALPVGALALVAFVLVEGRAAEPVLPLRLFGSRVFTLSNVAAFGVSMVMFGAIIYIPVFAQGVIGVDATNSGLILMPLMLGFIGLGILTGMAITRTGRYLPFMLTGIGVMAAGNWMLTRLDHTATQSQLTLAMVVLGLGLGMAMQQYTLVVQNDAARADLGVATASTQFFRNVGSTVGIAVFGTIMTSGLAEKIAAHLPAGAAAGAKGELNVGSVLDPSVLATMPPAVADAVRQGLAENLHNVFLVGLPILALVFVATALIPVKPLRETNHDHPAEEPGVGVVESLGSTEAHDVNEVHTGSRRTPFAPGNS